MLPYTFRNHANGLRHFDCPNVLVNKNEINNLFPCLRNGMNVLVRTLGKIPPKMSRFDGGEVSPPPRYAWWITHGTDRKYTRLPLVHRSHDTANYLNTVRKRVGDFDGQIILVLTEQTDLAMG